MSCGCSKKKPYNIIDVVRDTINGTVEYAEKETMKDRLRLCFECERLIELTNQCKECGCFVKLKVKYKETSCPLGKW